MAPQTRAPRRYRIGDLEVDSGRGFLRRGGADIYLRSQSFGLLIYLIEHRDRLVSKDELHRELWADVAVGDDAIVQCVADVRRALGDDPRAPAFIRTVSKLGYRFIAPVEITDEQRETDVTPAPAETASAALVTAPPARRLLRWQLLVPVVLAILVLAGWTATHLRPAEAAGSTTRRILVFDFDNTARDQDLSWLRHGLADMVITDLSRFDGVSVLSRQERDEIVRRSGANGDEPPALSAALEVARRARANLLLFGSYAAVNNRIRVEVRLHDAVTGRLLSADSATADAPAQIFTQIDVLSMKLARGPGIGAKPRDTQGLALARTNNLDAYRHYTLGLEHSRALRTTEAVASFEKAVALDPDFAMAHAAIGYTYGVRHAQLDLAKPFLQRAYAMSNRLTDRDRLQITAWYAITSRDYDTAIDTFQTLLDRYPDDTESATRLVQLLLGENRLAEARDTGLRWYAANPEDPGVANALGAAYAMLGQHADAIAMQERHVALTPENANAHDSLGLVLQWAGRYPEAIDSYERAIALDPSFEVALVHKGNAYFQMGRYRDAIRAYGQYVAKSEIASDRARGYGCMAVVELALGRLAAADAAARESERLGHATGEAFLIAVERGDPVKAEAAYRQAEARSPARGARGSGRYASYLEGRWALFQGRFDDAIAALREITRYGAPLYSMDAFEDALGQAYLKLGRLDDAIAEFERVLRLNSNFGPARFGLAQSLDRRGLVDRARAEYEVFLHSWRDADADAPLVVTARKRLHQIAAEPTRGSR
jgi:tetratricopeptide (TPR) repeat protein/DNA-binding winged helix-turn-helix (wHTH) protein